MKNVSLPLIFRLLLAATITLLFFLTPDPIAKGFIMLFGFIIVAIPIWVALGFTSLWFLNLSDAVPLKLVGESLFNGLDSFSLIAVPLFVLTGDVLVRTGLSEKLLDVALATVGSFKSGLGASTVMGCGLFACISGSDAADAAAIGRVTLHRLVEQGYPKPYACALVAAGACTGILIPPSISYIIIGLVLGISAATLFKAAVIPGIIILLTIMLTNVVINRFRNYESSERRFSFKHWLATVWDAKFALLVPFILLGGIYSGIFTPTESAAVAVMVIMVIGFFQGTLKLSDFPKMLESSAKINGVILPIIAFSLPLAQSISILGIPQKFVANITSLTDNRILLTLLMIAILMVAGMIMETTPNIVILAPILLPLAQSIGLNDVHFSILMVTSLGVGFITPPLGLNLFVLSSISKVPILPIAAKAVPFVFTMLVAVLFIAFVPWLSLVFLG